MKKISLKRKMFFLLAFIISILQINICFSENIEEIDKGEENLVVENTDSKNNESIIISEDKMFSAFLGGSTKNKYVTTIHYMFQCEDCFDITPDDNNYEGTETSELITTVTDKDTIYQEETATKLIDNIKFIKNGFSPYYERKIYERSDGGFSAVYKDGDTVKSDVVNKDYYIFYTNDAIWDTRNNDFRENSVTVETGEKLKNETISISCNGSPLNNGEKAKVGSDIIVHIEPNDGYSVNWTLKEVNTSIGGKHIPSSPVNGTGNDFSFKMGTKPVIITPKANTKTVYKITYAGLKGVGANSTDASFNGGNENPNPTGCVEGMEYVLTPPSATGKKFKGWQVNDDEHTFITDGMLKNVTANRTLTALWEDAKYTLSINYIYSGELRSDTPVNNSLIKVTMIRNNDKSDVILSDGQYLVDKSYVEFGDSEYKIALPAQTIYDIENAENGIWDIKQKVKDATLITDSTVSMCSTIKTIIKGEKFSYSPVGKISGEKKVKVTSTDKKIASVSKKGIIKGKKKEGLAEITKTVNGQTVSGGSIKVYNEVPSYPKTIVFGKAKESRDIGLSGISGEVKYESRNPSVCSVTEDGVVTAVGNKGKGVITMTIHGKVFKIKVKVGETEKKTTTQSSTKPKISISF